MNTKHLTEGQREKLRDVIHKYADAYVAEDYDLMVLYRHEWRLLEGMFDLGRYREKIKAH